MPNFEVFHREQLRPVETPTVTIRVNGGLSLNGAAYEAIGKSTWVQLLFDRTEKLIGIREAADAEADSAWKALPVRSIGGGASISCRSFVTFCGLNGVTGRRFPAELREGLLCVDVSLPGTTVSSNRRVSTVESGQETPA